jgi:hypothetical protein
MAFFDPIFRDPMKEIRARMASSFPASRRASRYARNRSAQVRLKVQKHRQIIGQGFKRGRF